MAYNYTVDERYNGGSISNPSGYYDAPHSINNYAVISENYIAYGTNVDSIYTSRPDVDTYSLGELNPGKYTVVVSNDTWDYSNPDNEGVLRVQVLNSTGNEVEIRSGAGSLNFTVNYPDTFYVSIAGGHSSTNSQLGIGGDAQYSFSYSKDEQGVNYPASGNSPLIIETQKEFGFQIREEFFNGILEPGDNVTYDLGINDLNGFMSQNVLAHWFLDKNGNVEHLGTGDIPTKIVTCGISCFMVSFLDNDFFQETLGPYYNNYVVQEHNYIPQFQSNF